METWFIILFSLSLCLFLSFIFSIRKPSQNTTNNLPPGPFSIPIITSLQWLVKSFSEIEPILRSLRAKYGPIITLQIGSRPAIFVTTHSLAHQALVQNGAVFADRPPALAVSKIISSNQYNISSAPYGPRWRLLRRNLTSEILHPSRVKSYTQARKWVLEILINRLKNHSESGEWFHVKEHFHYIMFCLLVLMCFGDKLDEEKIKEVQKVQHMMLLSFGRFNILNFLPSITRMLFRRRWEELYKVDTLLDLQLPEGNRKLEEKEIVSLCSEFLDAGTDTTSTALKALVLEGLRRHPPGHFVLPHAVTQDTVLNGFMIPKDGTINFMVAEMGLDPKVWKDPMEFNPERFLSNGGPEAFDITGSREIKMMPFGAGRRICPGFGLAMLHLEYFVANLVWIFKWMAVDGDDIDLSEKQEFTVVMKNPLKAHVSPRVK